MTLEPAEIQGQKLKRRIRGYSRAAVEQLLEKVAESYNEVWNERDQLRIRVEQLEKELAPLREAHRHVSDSLVTAERAAAEVRADAEERAEELLEEARRKSQEHRSGAQREHGRLTAEIRRLELVERELHTSLRAFLLAGLELVEDRDTAVEAPVVEVPVSAHVTGPASA